MVRKEKGVSGHATSFHLPATTPQAGGSHSATTPQAGGFHSATTGYTITGFQCRTTGYTGTRGSQQHHRLPLVPACLLGYLPLPTHPPTLPSTHHLSPGCSLATKNSTLALEYAKTVCLLLARSSATPNVVRAGRIQ